MYPATMSGYHNPNYGSDPNDLLGVINILSVGHIIGQSTGVPGKQGFYVCSSHLTPSGCIPRIATTNGLIEIPPGSNFTASLYPNPYQENTVVHVEVMQNDNFTISMYDMIGQLIFKKNISSDMSFDVPLTDFDKSAGMYLIEVSDSHNKQTLKMIKF
ncbi:MAG: hypothetical protein JWO03_2571 [Bacteroidetes bacterium]|nr:hypothetical protein [Bacteroidota bacterium]